MANVTKPLPFEQLKTKPPLPPTPRVSEDMQQVLSLLSGYDGQERRLLRVSKFGALEVVSPRLRDIVNITGSGAGDTWQGDRIACSEVMVIAHPDNAGRVWVNVDDAAAVDTGLPLDAGDHQKFSVESLYNLHLYIANDGEKAIVLYTD